MFLLEVTRTQFVKESIPSDGRRRLIALFTRGRQRSVCWLL